MQHFSSSDLKLAQSLRSGNFRCHIYDMRFIILCVMNIPDDLEPAQMTLAKNHTLMS